jgi:hypothetical protein
MKAKYKQEYGLPEGKVNQSLWPLLMHQFQLAIRLRIRIERSKIRSTKEQESCSERTGFRSQTERH